MDELEVLKQHWKKQEQGLPKLSYDDIYKMILKRSSSMVKWIFIISVLEFLLWGSLDVFFRVNGQYDEIKTSGMENYLTISSVVSYGILIYFIIRFYLNYKKIQTTDSAKVLMQNILKTRNTVKLYVWINLSFLAVLFLTTMSYSIFFTDDFQNGDTKEVPVWLILGISVIVIIVFIAVIALFYRLVYGILTRRLKKNYDELEQLQM
ncbi:hypothetical protein ACJRPK_13485 [Aquimarina sp. 2-A2]|uniref:hypothetical protein n=1 Tax=Aquimarina sp. 2-A2 TaxID=3382644 RepID=UPI00387EEEFA